MARAWHNADMTLPEVTLRWGPCDGDVITLEDSEVLEIRVPCVCGTCLDEIPEGVKKDAYTEAVYLPDSLGNWFYAGRIRYGDDAKPFWSAG
jgi:hypothetical protein